jgi:hypothetical protein
MQKERSACFAQTSDDKNRPDKAVNPPLKTARIVFCYIDALSMRKNATGAF